MSYVLEALKKQEAEQNPEVAVSLSLTEERKRRYRLLTWLVGATLIVNAGMLFWLVVWPRLEQEQQQTISDTKAPDTATSRTDAASPPSTSPGAPAGTDPAGVDPAGVDPAGVDPAGVDPWGVDPATATEASAGRLSDSSEIRSRPPAEAASTSANLEAEPEPKRAIVKLDQLPAGVRGRFPGLAFSTHVYADDRDLRAVVANGQRLMEGDSLRGVTVHEITESGVVLAFETYLIEVPVAGYWD